MSVDTVYTCDLCGKKFDLTGLGMTLNAIERVQGRGDVPRLLHFCFKCTDLFNNVILFGKNKTSQIKKAIGVEG